MSVEYSDLESISEKIINILKTKYYNQIINSNHIIIDMFDFINLEFNIYSMFDVFDKLLRSLIVNICIENKFKEILEEELTIEYKNLYGIECNFINLPKYINKIVNIEGNITSFYLPENIAIGYEVLCVKDYNHTHKIRLKNIQNNNNEEDKDVNIYTCRVCGSYASKNVIYKNFCYFILEDLTSNIYTQVMCRCDYNIFLKENLTLSDYIEVIGMVKLDDDNKIFIEVLSILKKSSIYIDQNKVNEVVDMLKRFSPKERYEFLVNNFAKHIYGLRMVKEAILLQLASPVLDKPLKRLHLHILLVGDPSTAKSQLLLYVKNIIPKSIYTTGKGSTAAGLGASINKDSKGKFIVAAGALVKSDKSICCIDEFSTMSESDKELLHEVMEQSTCSIAKAGIYMQFNARTRLLCAMNPVNVLYNPYRTLFENTSLKPSLLSRFDIIIVLKDVFDVDYDT
ncbi:MAG: AAA family ATPase, partial [Ignisphaera sp.]